MFTWKKVGSILVILLLGLIVSFNNDEATIDNEFYELQKLNREVNAYWKHVGKGYPLGQCNIKFDEFLQSREGSCSQQSYLLARQALQKGYSVRRIGLWATGGANDVMVEILVKDKWILFVPSAGVYYPFGLSALLEDPNKSGQYVGGRPSSESYLNSMFFGNIYQADYYRNLNNAETSLFKGVKSVHGKNLYASPNGASAAVDGVVETYAAGKEGEFPQDINITWEEPVSIYRIWFNWYSAQDYSADFQIEIFGVDGFETIFRSTNEDPLFADGGQSEIGLAAAVRVRKMRIRFFGADGQNRLLLRDMGIY